MKKNLPFCYLTGLAFAFWLNSSPVVAQSKLLLKPQSQLTAMAAPKTPFEKYPLLVKTLSDESNAVRKVPGKTPLKLKGKTVRRAKANTEAVVPEFYGNIIYTKT